MRKLAVATLLVLAILTACGPRPSGGPADLPTERPAPTSLPSSPAAARSPLEEMVVRQLAGNLGLEPSQIFVASNASVRFADACFGVAMPGVMCAQVETPGHIIVVESDGVQYEYHVNENGSRIQPASMVLVWKREGGIAGFCDELMVFRSGEVYGNRCEARAEGRMGTFGSLLTPADRKEFQGWLLKFGHLSVDASDPKGVSDRMLVTLSFQGTGAHDTASSSEKQALLEFAASIYQQLFSQQAPDR